MAGCRSKLGMKTLFCILSIVALLPMAALSAGHLNKQIDKAEKDTLPKTGQHDSKQGKPAAMALDPERFEFVRSNLVSTFYHELAHALIDTMDLPVLGQEEDAADVFSVLMVERFFEDSDAIAINTGAARGFEVDAVKMRGKGREWNWADEHGPDMQRYYNIVCLTYGSAPKARGDFASNMKLPEDRAEICADEFALAKNSWEPIIDTLARAKNSPPMRFRHSARSALQIRAAGTIAAEVKRVNKTLGLPTELRVIVKRCARSGSYYAYYSSSREKITICTNYIDELYRDAPI